MITRTASEANLSGPPGPIDTEAATQSARKPATTASSSRGVDPGGISPHSGAPARRRSAAAAQPPAGSSRAGHPTLSNATPPSPAATSARPRAIPRRPSDRTITAAPSQATKAAASLTARGPPRLACDRECEGDQRRQPQNRATRGRGRLQRARIQQRSVLLGQACGPDPLSPPVDCRRARKREQRRHLLTADWDRTRSEVGEHAQDKERRKKCQ